MGDEIEKSPEFQTTMERPQNDMDPSHQIVLTHKMMEVGKGATVFGHTDMGFATEQMMLMFMERFPDRIWPEVAENA